MTMIKEDHVEWAVIDRLQKLLEGAPHPEFNVTHSLALFLGILTWVKNRKPRFVLHKTNSRLGLEKS